MTHRQTPQNRVYSRMKRMNAKAFNAFLPEPIHALLKRHAVEAAASQGGQTNMNKVLVKSLLETYGLELSDDERTACLRFLEET